MGPFLSNAYSVTKSKSSFLLFSNIVSSLLGAHVTNVSIGGEREDSSLLVCKSVRVVSEKDIPSI